MAGAQRLLTVSSGLPPIMPNSALALMLLGGAGALVLMKQSPRGIRAVVQGAAIVVLAISVASLAEYALGSTLLLNRLVPHQVAYPGPSSPPSAVALALLALGLLLLDWRPGRKLRPGEWLILAAALIAVTALLGYLYGASANYRLTGAAVPGIPSLSLRVIRVAGDLLVIGVSFFTALGLFLISTGLFLGRSDWRTLRLITGPGPGGLLLRRLMPVVFLVPIGFGIIASRFPGTADHPVVLAGLTDGTTILGLLVLGITGRKLNQGHFALEHARKRARDLIELASDGIFIANLAGRLTEVNAAGCRLVGYACDELIGKSIAALMPPADTVRLAAHRRRLLEGRTEVGEWAAIHKDGSVFPVEISARILPDGRWIGIIRDISVRKRMEDALRASEAMARQATIARDDMLGIVAHDLRNPLQVVATGARLLHSSKNEAVRKTAGEIQAATRRMDRLIQDLLDVTRIDAGQLFLRPGHVPVMEVVEDTLRTQKVLADAANIALEAAVPCGLPEIWADPGRLMQALDNLIGNAIKFTAPGGAITLAAQAGPGEVVFSVCDNGRGIAAEDLPHVFDRFWQTSRTRKTGAGLGLAIVKGIAEAHGGRAWAQSVPGKGSSFFLAIPTMPSAKANVDRRAG